MRCKTRAALGIRKVEDISSTKGAFMGPKTADNKGAELNGEIEKLFEMDNREREENDDAAEKEKSGDE